MMDMIFSTLILIWLVVILLMIICGLTTKRK